MIRLVFIITALLATGAARAQTADEYRDRQRDLAALASVFGELHHIRRLCEPRLESDVWRERMKRLVELEQPQPEAHEELIKRFNNGYRNAGDHFARCDRRARDYAAGRARYAQRVVRNLAEPLREAAASETFLVTVPQATDDTD
ncbi:MAG: TIGR02301 family protein [Pseudomonadota bacterium]